MQQPAELLEKSLDRKSIYWKAIPLLPGLYRLDIAIKDVNNPDHIGIYGRGLDVPTYHDEKLATSSLILADQMYPVEFARDRRRQLRDRQHQDLPESEPERGYAGQLQA